MTDQISILKVLVGSQAHGLAEPTSDYDYRGVFVVPTEELLKLGTTLKNTNWIEGDVDNTSWEVAHFLFLATKSNPTILETFLAPVEGAVGPWGRWLRDLFPYVWGGKAVRDAFTGYGLNQRKKMLDDKDGKAAKFAVANLRVLHQAYELLWTGKFSVDFRDTEVYPMLKEWRRGHFSQGSVIDTTNFWRERVEEAYEYGGYKDKQPDMDVINEYLLDVRRAFFNPPLRAT